MYNILAAIGLITILAILFFLYLNSIDRKKEEEKDNYDLAKYSDKCENIEKNASSVDEVHKKAGRPTGQVSSSVTPHWKSTRLKPKTAKS